MDLVSLAISILWLLIGVIIILGVIWLALYVVKMFVALPDPVEKAVWAIVLILILIAVLTMFLGGGKVRTPFSRGELQLPVYASTTIHNERGITCVV